MIETRRRPRAIGRRRVLHLAGAAALSPAVPLGARAQDAAAPTDAPLLTIPPPDGWSALSPGDPARRQEAAWAAEGGTDLLGAFAPDGDAPFQFASATGDASWRRYADIDRFDALVAEDDGVLRPYEREGGPPMAFSGYSDLRVARRRVDHDAWLWLGVATGPVADAAADPVARLLVGTASLRLDGKLVQARLSRALGPDERPDIDGGWDVMLAWAAAIRAANVVGPIPAAPRYGLLGTTAEIPAPPGFAPMAEGDRTLEARRRDALPGRLAAVFVPATGEQGVFEPGAEEPGTRFEATLRMSGDRPVGTRSDFEVEVRVMRLDFSYWGAFPGLAGVDAAPGAWIVGSVESADGFAILRLTAAPPGGDAPPVRALRGSAVVWIEERVVALDMLALDRAGDDASIAAAWALFRDWVATVVAANGGA